MNMLANCMLAKDRNNKDSRYKTTIAATKIGSRYDTPET
jgi:hypothetical protein